MKTFIINKIDNQKVKKQKGYIRLCNTKDVDAIYNIQEEIIGYFKEEEKGYFLPFRKESYLRIVNNPKTDGKIYGAFLNNEMIGWIFLSVAPRLEELKKHLPNLKGKSADIDGIIVLPKYRGNKLQIKLMKYIEKIALKEKVKNLIAEITVENKYSLNNAEKLGYKIQTQYKKDETITRYILLKKIKSKTIDRIMTIIFLFCVALNIYSLYGMQQLFESYFSLDYSKTLINMSFSPILFSISGAGISAIITIKMITTIKNKIFS
ncbi:MAG: GNAT family N-acetyltransferase [Bacilli bacterium]|nr:GNAT family N-acetyltransferase [Bacilli bacterium]